MSAPERSEGSPPADPPGDASAPESTSPAPGIGARVAHSWRWLRRRWWSRWAIDLTVIAAIFWAVSAYQGRHLIDAGEPAPTFELQTLDGALHDMADNRGEKTLLAFWAPWCTVCGLEMSNLNSMHDSGFNVVSVALGYEDLESVHAFVDEHELEFPVLLGDSRVQQAYAVNAFPTVYILDEDGRVEHSVVGYTTTAGLRLRLSF